jgi:hypothetical protein
LSGNPSVPQIWRLPAGMYPLYPLTTPISSHPIVTREYRRRTPVSNARQRIVDRLASSFLWLLRRHDSIIPHPALELISMSWIVESCCHCCENDAKGCFGGIVRTQAVQSVSACKSPEHFPLCVVYSYLVQTYLTPILCQAAGLIFLSSSSADLYSGFG